MREHAHRLDRLAALRRLIIVFTFVLRKLFANAWLGLCCWPQQRLNSSALAFILALVAHRLFAGKVGDSIS